MALSVKKDTSFHHSVLKKVVSQLHSHKRAIIVFRTRRITIEEAWLANDLVTSTWIAMNEGNYGLSNSKEQALAKRD